MAGAPETLAHLAGGRLTGLQLGGDCTAYLGIRYGQSTGGARRWQPPKSPPRWSGVHEAVSFGPGCFQPASPP